MKRIHMMAHCYRNALLAGRGGHFGGIGRFRPISQTSVVFVGFGFRVQGLIPLVIQGRTKAFSRLCCWAHI